MRITNLATCAVCGRVVRVTAGRLVDHARKAFAWNTCPGSGQAPA